MERIILHCDINNCFASIECAENPGLKGKPIAVCGDPEDRHGIVLAKSYEAKEYGVQTGETIWQARLKCPSLITVKPHYDTYMRYSKAARTTSPERTAFKTLIGFPVVRSTFTVTSSSVSKT